MRLLRFGGRGIEKPGLVDPDGQIRDVSVYLSDLDETIVSPTALAALRALDWHLLPIIEATVRLGPILERANRVIAIGGELRGAAADPLAATLKGARPTGPNDAIEIPRYRTRVRMRVALGVVVGTTLRHATAAEALHGIAGYCVANDVTDIDGSEQSDLAALAGSAETFAPLGPHLVTADEIDDVAELHYWLEVNGVRQYSGSLGETAIGVVDTLSRLTCSIRLWPGDVILFSAMAARFTDVRAGDATIVGISRLGDQRQCCETER
jgi:2-keto-4-pentenoate hydratase/2-oxohepta-3-ene-1,7-dioic acid hydratase in catechol pathway